MAAFKQYTKKDGSKWWLFKAYLGTDPITGKRLETTRRGFETKKEAQLALNRLVSGLEEIEKEEKQAELERQNKPTFQEVYDLWVENYELTVKESTFVKQTELYQVHILPVFGKKIIDQITAADVQKFANEKSKEYVRYREFISNTSRIFDYAIKMRIISENPVKFITIPRRGKKSRNAELNYYTKNELNQFLKVIDQNENPKISTFFRLLCMSGARMGEILGLEWRHVNFEDNYISIVQTLAKGKGERLYLESPKTDSSKREIPLDAKTMRQLKVWRKYQKLEMNGFGHNTLKPDQLVFSNYENNSFMQLTTPRKWLNTILKQNDFRRITLHGFRHTYATMMLESGLTLKDVSERLGHASIEITADLYIHITKKRKEENVQHVMEYLESN